MPLRQSSGGVVVGDVQIAGAHLDNNLVELSKQLPTIIDSATNLADVPKIPLKFVSISGLNDAYHQINKPNSEHTKGKAVDFTLNRAPTVKEGEKLVALLKTKGKFSKVIDEYNNKLPGSTGGHIHAEVSGTSEQTSAATGPTQSSSTSPSKIINDVPPQIIDSTVPPAAATVSADATAKEIVIPNAIEPKIATDSSLIPQQLASTKATKATKETYNSGIITGFNPRDYASEIDKMIPELQKRLPFHKISELRRKAEDIIKKRIVTKVMSPQGTTAVQSDSGVQIPAVPATPMLNQSASNSTGTSLYTASAANSDLKDQTNSGTTVINAPQNSVVNNSQTASNKNVREKPAETSNAFQKIYNKLVWV